MYFFYIAVAAIAPVLLILAGKRFLGSRTHPAAIFILAWILCSFLLTLADVFPISSGIASFAWVAICFSTITMIRKRKSAFVNSGSEDSPESSDDPSGS